jgi:hypothetical protein
MAERGPWCEEFSECVNKNVTTFDCNDQWIEYPTTTPTTMPPPEGVGAPTAAPPPGADTTTTTTPTTTPTTVVSHWNTSAPLPLAPDCRTDVGGCRPPEKNYTAMKTLGRLYKTVHITFKAEERRKRSRGIYEKWEPQKIEGVLIQANHNPFGVGLPTGEFFDEDITCFDCGGDHFVEIIPCRKRPSVEVMVSLSVYTILCYRLF